PLSARKGVLAPPAGYSSLMTVLERPATSPRLLARDVLDGFRRNDLLTYASAIAFQLATAILPFLLFAFALLGFLNLDHVWSKHVAPELRHHVSPHAYAVIADTVRRVLGSKQLFWVTAGAALAIWEISGAVRAVMGAFDGIYESGERRTFKEKLAASLALAVGVGLLFLAAAAVVRLGPALYGHASGLGAVVSFLVRWLLAAGLLGVGVGLLVRYAAAVDQPLPWVSFGTLLVIAAWVVMSIGFGVYVTSIVSYGSIFGPLATIFVLLLYLYASAIVFLGGAQLDAAVRRRVGS
ncbi:MAG: YihY/virulence factor BrkB family protein, partial [Gemmatimonadales bacterium]